MFYLSYAAYKIRYYLDAFVSNLCRSENILGILLYGSIAGKNLSQFSDIDTLILSNSSFLSSLELVEQTINKLEPLRRDLLVSKGNFLNISPLILTPPDLEELHPIFFDIAEQGIILFERNRIITNFISRIRKIKHERNDEMDMIQWTEEASGQLRNPCLGSGALISTRKDKTTLSASMICRWHSRLLSRQFFLL